MNRQGGKSPAAGPLATGTNPAIHRARARGRLARTAKTRSMNAWIVAATSHLSATRAESPSAIRSGDHGDLGTRHRFGDRHLGRWPSTQGLGVRAQAGNAGSQPPGLRTRRRPGPVRRPTAGSSQGDASRAPELFRAAGLQTDPAPVPEHLERRAVRHRELQRVAADVRRGPGHRAVTREEAIGLQGVALICAV